MGCICDYWRFGAWHRTAWYAHRERALCQIISRNRAGQAPFFARMKAVRTPFGATSRDRPCMLRPDATLFVRGMIRPPLTWPRCSLPVCLVAADRTYFDSRPQRVPSPQRHRTAHLRRSRRRRQLASEAKPMEPQPTGPRTRPTRRKHRRPHRRRCCRLLGGAW